MPALLLKFYHNASNMGLHREYYGQIHRLGHLINSIYLDSEQLQSPDTQWALDCNNQNQNNNSLAITQPTYFISSMAPQFRSMALVVYHKYDILINNQLTQKLDPVLIGHSYDIESPIFNEEIKLLHAFFKGFYLINQAFIQNNYHMNLYEFLNLHYTQGINIIEEVNPNTDFLGEYSQYFHPEIWKLLFKNFNRIREFKFIIRNTEYTNVSIQVQDDNALDLSYYQNYLSSAFIKENYILKHICKDDINNIFVLASGSDPNKLISPFPDVDF